MNIQFEILVPVILYFSALYGLVQIILGFKNKQHKKNAHSTQNSEEVEYFLGGRKVGFLATSLSAHASDMSAWLFMAFPVLVMTQGLEGILVGFGLVFGMALNWSLIAPKVRLFSESLGCTTLSDLTCKRFNDHKGHIGKALAAVVVFFMLVYLASGLQALGMLLQDVTHISYHQGLLLGLAIALAFTYGGGHLSVAYTDLMQAIFLLAALLIVVGVGIEHAGGLAAVFNNYPKVMSERGVEMVPHAFKTLSLLLVGMSWGLGYLGMPHIISRFLGMSSVKDIPKARSIGLAWQFVALGGAVLIGMIAAIRFGEAPGQSPLADNQMMFIEMVKADFSPLIAGLILCGLISATISTLDSQLLVASSTLVGDFLSPLFPKKKIGLRFSRFLIVVLGLVALAMVWNKNQSIFTLVNFAWYGMGGTLGPMLLMAINERKKTPASGLQGLAISTVVVLVWPWLQSRYDLVEIPSLLLAFSLSLGWMFWKSKLPDDSHSRIDK